MAGGDCAGGDRGVLVYLRRTTLGVHIYAVGGNMQAGVLPALRSGWCCCLFMA